MNTLKLLTEFVDMTLALQDLAVTMDIEYAHRPWREVFKEIEENYEVLKASHDFFYEVPEWYDGADDQYGDEDTYEYDENDYFYNEGLDYI